jgi:chromosome segregation ATPase
MKAFRQLGFLKLPFQRAQASPDDHRVLTLFRNRAELKKAFGDLKDDLERLKDRIKQQEGVTRRVRETLAALEARLGVNETAYPALVFYQLRHMWQRGHEQLERFGGELVTQQDAHERRAHLAEHNRQQFAKRQTAEQHLQVMRQIAAQAAERLENLEHERARLRRLWHFFKRRTLEHTITRARAESAEANVSLESAQQAAAEIAATPVPQFPGLSLQARRMINLTVLAYAQVMCQRLTVMPLLLMRVRDAVQSRDVIDEYGTRTECLALMGQIERAEALLGSNANVSRDIRERLKALRLLAQYRDPEDAIPTADSLGGGSAQAVGSPAGIPDVLAEDTWHIHGVLLR